METINVSRQTLLELSDELDAIRSKLDTLLAGVEVLRLTPVNSVEEVASRVRNSRCLSPDCTCTEIVSRGLCRPCRDDFRKHVRAGRTTEDRLIRAGWMLPRGKSGRKPKNATVLNEAEQLERLIKSTEDFTRQNGVNGNDTRIGLEDERQVSD